MPDIKLFFPDGKVKEYPQGTTPQHVLDDFGGRLRKEALVCGFNEILVDMNKPLTTDGELKFYTFADREGANAYRHTASHVLAQAVKRLYPDALLGIGPAIENGFYYDFDRTESFSTEDLDKLETEMNKIIKEDLPLERSELSKEEAIDLFSRKGEIYKKELVLDLPDDVVISCYRQGEFIDLCAGPHLLSTGKLKAVKLMNLAGAYWRGSEHNPMLQRIYGTAFPKKSQLDDYLYRTEEAKKRDHRRLGRELDLFSLHEEGPGFPFFHPKGMIILNQLESFWREEHIKAGYQEIKTPIILNRELWERSGHWDHYRENMYFTTIDETDYAVKPMNCPGSMLIYKSNMHSYKEFPIRMAELGLVHRHELSGTLHGLMRVRSFTQDDAHIYMTPEQIKAETNGVIKLVDRFYSAFGLPYDLELSTKPDKALGSDEIWETTTKALKDVLDERGVPYVINEGDGAFYGPKIDFHVRDSLDRTWQCGTVQLDFLMPEKFDLSYVGPDGEKHRPVMLHRVIYGSLERFLAILIEHFGGAFPLWLAPVQALIVPIAERHHEYALKVQNLLGNAGFRVEIDDRSEKVGYKIREAEVKKTPYILVAGDKEAEQGNVAMRLRGQGDQGTLEIDDLIARMYNQIKEKI